MQGQADHDIIHATTICVEDRAAVIVGPSGSGKSALALQLVALGARLVADDRTALMREGPDLFATAPPQIAGMIEARGIGILRIEPVPRAKVFWVVNLAQTETARMPEPKTTELLGLSLPCLYRVEGPHFAASVLLCLKGRLS